MTKSRTQVPRHLQQLQPDVGVRPGGGVPHRLAHGRDAAPLHLPIRPHRRGPSHPRAAVRGHGEAVVRDEVHQLPRRVDHEIRGDPLAASRIGGAGRIGVNRLPLNRRERALTVVATRTFIPARRWTVAPRSLTLKRTSSSPSRSTAGPWKPSSGVICQVRGVDAGLTSPTRVVPSNQSIDDWELTRRIRRPAATDAGAPLMIALNRIGFRHSGHSQPSFPNTRLRITVPVRRTRRPSHPRQRRDLLGEFHRVQQEAHQGGPRHAPVRWGRAFCGPLEQSGPQGVELGGRPRVVIRRGPIRQASSFPRPRSRRCRR